MLEGAKPIAVRSGASSIALVPLDGVRLDGSRRTIEVGPTEPRQLALFLSVDCDGCLDLFAAARVPSSLGLGEADRVIVVLRSAEEPEPGRLIEMLGGVDHVIAPDAWLSYGVSGPPFFSLLDPAYATVATEGVAWGAASVAEAVRAARAGTPDVEVPRLSGGDVE